MLQAHQRSAPRSWACHPQRSPPLSGAAASGSPGGGDQRALVRPTIRLEGLPALLMKLPPGIKEARPATCHPPLTRCLPSALPRVTGSALPCCPARLICPVRRYEDEEEFDALTDAMKPKTVVLVAAPSSSSGAGAGGEAEQQEQEQAAAAVAGLRSYLQELTFNQAFSSSQVRLSLLAGSWLAQVALRPATWVCTSAEVP